MLYFDTNIPSELFQTISEVPGYDNMLGDKVRFKNMYEVENEDVNKTIREVNHLLNTENDGIVSPHDTYKQMIKYIHDVGFVYSSFIEVIFANSYVNKDNIILRYAFNDPKVDSRICKKIGLKKLHTLIKSSILSFLYEPNSTTLTKNYNNFERVDKNSSIFERIWAGEL
jgi:hypothetical protein